MYNKTTIIEHIGTMDQSGRYKRGSGERPQASYDIYTRIDDLKRRGFKGTEVDLAKALGMNTSQFRAAKSAATASIKEKNFAEVNKRASEGQSVARIVHETGIAESTVRGYLKPQDKVKRVKVNETTNALKAMVEENEYIDVGAGSETFMGISRTQLNNAVTNMRNEGYKITNIQVPQLGSKIGAKTTIKVLTKEDVKPSDIYDNRDKISVPNRTKDLNGEGFNKFYKPKSISIDRVEIRYAEDGGTARDGLMLVRDGAEGLDLGKSKYAQVRIPVNDSHYIKGMCMRDTEGILPPGKDVIFFSNKPKDKGWENALKEMKDANAEDPAAVFGSSIIKQKGSLNIVNEEGSWLKWSSTLSSQMLSKQRPSLIKEQLEKTLKVKQDEFDEIMSLTNPAVKASMLKTFAEELDSAAVSLKAVGLGRTATHVILPFEDIPDGQIYAPKYKDGETVVLIRHPHGGTFEIPQLVVNNKLKGPKGALGDAIDAVGINAKAAEQLSGADFDGDTALVIPNNSGKVKVSKQLDQLKDFDTKAAYPGYPGMKVMSDTQKQMGMISNLLTDMTIKDAPIEDIAKAVKHSMVVIDAKKHKLNYKQSEVDNNIKSLKEKYQPKELDPETGKMKGGASTLISRAGQEVRINERKIGYSKNDIDKETGKINYKETGNSYTDSKTGQVKFRESKVDRLSITDDARDLSTGTVRENLYADYSNAVKKMANDARLAWVEQPNIVYKPAMAKVYADEVKSLNDKLNMAKSNAPVERQAQIVGANLAQEIIKNSPPMTKAEISSVNAKALTRARGMLGAGKDAVKITPQEWDAIQAGAVSNSKVVDILNNADSSIVRQLATPRQTRSLNDAQVSKARTMLNNNNSIADVAEILGVSTTTLIETLDL